MDQCSQWLIGRMMLVISFANRRRISVRLKGNQRRGCCRLVLSFAGGGDGEDGVGEHDQAGVPVPEVPTADRGLVHADGRDPEAVLTAGKPRPPSASRSASGP
jgi:hypothetical protein